MHVRILSPPSPGQRILGTPLSLVVAVLGLLALLSPFGQAEQPWRRVGVLLAAGGGLQVLHGVRRAESAALRRAVSGGVLSILMGLLVLILGVLPAGAQDELLSLVAPDCDYGGNLASIEAVDSLTVRITLCNPDAIFDQELASMGLAVHPREHLEATGGTGEAGR